MTHFWAKTTLEGKLGISVLDHMGNVGCVAQEIAGQNKNLLELFSLGQSLVASLAALHDLGKISPGFQRKSKTWLEENNLTSIDQNDVWDTLMEPDHGKVTHSALQEFELLKAEYAKLAETWEIKATFETAIPDVGMKTFLDGMVAHVI